MKFKLGLVLLLVIVLVVLVGPLFSSFDAETIHWDDMAIPPDATYWMGTDVMGRDLFIRTLQGGQVSLMVGLVATLVSVIIGVCYGMVAGFFGGRVDAVMMRLVDVLYALPFLFLVILLMVFFGQYLWLLFVAIGCYLWLDMARIVRGQTMMLKTQTFVEASQALGQSDKTILFSHILPNLKGVVVVYATLLVPQVIMIESFLSFLGLGVQEPMTSWGALVNEGASNMDMASWSLLFPALFLALTLIGFNLVGDGLRDRWDPALNKQ
ncbi:ABC transporter permease subunit [Marinicella sp. S1101]|uniref:ABC transporter permease n=1 Tax=Marinicella marina TaxID=2996016 RepID=UPI002260B72E|nr:ABC transporter permease subunit [Marinicella marina]MCX7552584.1 ABC transporter permease subunit [Marinicella marina]MDJ1139460.1 ABC transporter permease subunit [Marinicella marina]